MCSKTDTERVTAPDADRLRQQFAFCLEMDKEKNIGRQTYLADGIRKENDAEHAWHMAVMTLILGEYANEEIDLLRTISMLLIHDVVEIDAGDTYAYDEEGKKPSTSVSWLRPTACTACFHPTRAKKCGRSGTSLRPVRHRKPASRARWTTSSLPC